jgi:dihydrofolate synthase/folylpolyglutamate synthase
MFHRVGEPALKPGLKNTLELCSILGNPQHKFKSIHIAGTNGKGSSSHMLASIFQEAGYKTGLYTSPHLKRFTERIRINGKEIPEEKVIQFVSARKKDFERIKPSFFEMTVALAFDYFAEEKVDLAVIETGLGGRLDSTNIIMPLASLITNISFDHENILGKTLKEIASEKAGIIKQGTPVVLSEVQEEVYEVFHNKAKEQLAPLFRAPQIFQVNENFTQDGKFYCNVYREGKPYMEDLCLDLGGNYQAKNLPGVLTVVEILERSGYYLDRNNIRFGLQKVISNTGLKGRWQLISKKPMIICDTAHNAAGIEMVVEQLKGLKYNKLHFVFGTVNDKKPHRILKLLPKEAIYYFTRPGIPRGLKAETLMVLGGSMGLFGKVYPTVPEAVEAAKKNASAEDVIFIGGSNFVVAEVEEI